MGVTSVILVAYGKKKKVYFYVIESLSNCNLGLFVCTLRHGGPCRYCAGISMPR